MVASVLVAGEAVGVLAAVLAALAVAGKIATLVFAPVAFTKLLTSLGGLSNLGRFDLKVRQPRYQVTVLEHTSAVRGSVNKNGHVLYETTDLSGTGTSALWLRLGSTTIPIFESNSSGAAGAIRHALSDQPPQFFAYFISDGNTGSALAGSASVARPIEPTSGHRYPTPTYVNNAQEVVGYYNFHPLNTVFLWKDGVTHDLDLTALNLPEDYLVDTPFINDEGVVVGVIRPTAPPSSKIYRINTRSQNSSPAELVYQSSGFLSIVGWTNNGKIYFTESTNSGGWAHKVWSGGSIDTISTDQDLRPVVVNNRDEMLAFRGVDVVLLVGGREFKVADLTETPLRTDEPIEPIAIGDGGHILLRQGNYQGELEGLLLTPNSTEAL